MRFHPLAVSIVVGTLGSSSMTDAFVFPKPASIGSTSTSLRMVAKNAGSPYSGLEENIFDPNRNDASNVDNASTSADSPSTPPKKPKKPNPRTEKLRAKLEADLSAAEESRARTAQELANAEASRQALEAQAEKAAKEAEAIEAKLNAFQAKEAARAAGGGGLGAGGIVGEIAGPLVGGIAAFGGLAAARESLAARSEKAEEERLQREEAERQAEQAAKRKAAQETQTKNLLPIVGAGVAGLGAFGAFFNSGNGGDTVVDAMSKNVETKVGQNNAGSVTTSIPDPATVDLPYLDKEIKKAETKQNQIKPFSKMQLGKKEAEEQKAVEARLEAKLAQAPELNQKAREAEAKAAEEARIEAEEKAAEEKKALEAKQAEERAKAQKEAAEKKAADEAALAAEKAKAEKIAADKLAFEQLKAEQAAKASKLAEEEQAKRDKIAADKLAFEQIRAEQQAKDELKAREEEAAAALELLKQQDAQWKDFIPKVPAVSEMLFGDSKPSLITDKGLSNIFSPNLFIVGGVALAGVAVATAVAAANESPAVSSTFKVTGKTPKEYLESGDASNDTTVSPAPASAPKKTIRIPKPDKAPPATPKTTPAPGSKEALREEMKKQRDNLSKQVAAKEASVEIIEEDAQSSSSPVTDATPIELSTFDASIAEPAFTPPAKKSYSPFGGKPKAVANDSLYSPPASQSMDQFVPSTPEVPATEQSAVENASFNAMPKKSYSPFGGKPKAVANDSLYSPPTSASTMPGVVDTEPTFEPVEPATFQEESGETSSFTFPKKSYSPFGGGKPKPVANNSLYSPPASASTNQIESPVEPIQPTTFSGASGVTPSTTYAKSSYSPFGRGKPTAATSDPLYSPPASYSEPESMSSTTDMVEEYTPVPSMESDVSTFDDSNLDNIGSASDFESPATYEPTIPSPEAPSFTQTSPPVKKSYSPFGQKPYVATNDSLYGPPTLDGPSPSAEYETPKIEPTASFTNDPSLPPKNYSPFGGAKPFAPSDDSLYSPPPEEQYDAGSNVEGSLPFAASGLDDTPGVAGPETTAFRASSPKKSFSPFGIKPQAPSDTNSGGYLNEL